MSASGPSGPLVLSSAVFFFVKLTFSKNTFRNNARIVSKLDPDQVRHFVRPDLSQYSLQRLSVDDTQRVNPINVSLNLQ